VKTGSDDVQFTDVGFIPQQPDVLNSFDDWGSVDLNLLDGLSASGNGTTDQEPDSNTVRESRRYMSEMMAPLVALDQTGPATAKPGDLLTYSVKITNTGRGVVRFMWDVRRRKGRSANSGATRRVLSPAGGA
jgi:hypothetical protein